MTPTAWRKVDWAKVHDQLDRLDLLPAVEHFASPVDGEEDDMELIGKFHALQDLMVGYIRLLVDNGDMQFTPQSINPAFRFRPMEIIEGWLQEGTEEYIFGGREVRVRVPK
jgi:hypothetical protein